MENQKSRIYIGKGVKPNPEYDLVNQYICIDDAEPYFFEKDGKRWLGFTTASLREKDKYGKTHTVFITERNSVKNTNAQTKPQKQPISQEQSDLPF